MAAGMKLPTRIAIHPRTPLSPSPSPLTRDRIPSGWRCAARGVRGIEMSGRDVRNRSCHHSPLASRNPQHGPGFRSRRNSTPDIAGDANHTIDELDVVLDRLILLVEEGVLHSRADVTAKKKCHRVDLDGEQSEGAGLEDTPRWQVTQHEEEALRTRIDPALLAEDELHEIGGIKRLF